MNKAASLRRALESACPALAANPDQLLMYIDNGHVAARLGGLGFEYRYTVTLVLLDFAANLDTVIVPIIAWLQTHQPSLLQNPDSASKAIRYRSEQLTHSSTDIELQLDLSERVRVTVSDSNATVEHLPEPQLAEVWDISRLRVYLKDELIHDSQH